jgi:hypothetical protein
MSPTQRTVKQLRLRAPSEAAVRRLMPTMEDALRCASLGDEGARLIVVRKLALGRVPAGVSSQALSRLIEERTAEAARQWVDAASDVAARAPSVAFASALDARVQLALRLLRGQACDAWYWPLAVAEFEPRSDVAGNVRRIAGAIARWPEARVALPAWVAALAGEGLVVRLAAMISEAEGEVLVQSAGLVLAPAGYERGDRASSPSHSGRSAESGIAARVAASAPTMARWLQCALRATTAAAPYESGTSMQDTADDRSPHAAAEPAVLPMADGPDAFTPIAPTAAAFISTSAPAADRHAATSSPTSPAQQAAPSIDAARPSTHPSPRSMHRTAPIRWPWRAPTSCGGLLFLLPVLARLGLPQRLHDDDAACRFTAAVLRLALQRSHAPPDDPMWQLVLAGEEAVPPEAAAALAQTRRWLHHAGRLGLVRLVRRPARLSWTPTHVDLHFTLDQCDLGVRRLGLDLDPGWLPWFGRVVGFHYLPRDA